jgi:hypothetical protein
MYWSSAYFSSWFRLKGKSRKREHIIISTKPVFVKFRLGGFGGCSPAAPPLGCTTASNRQEVGILADIFRRVGKPWKMRRHEPNFWCTGVEVFKPYKTGTVPGKPKRTESPMTNRRQIRSSLFDLVPVQGVKSISDQCRRVGNHYNTTEIFKTRHSFSSSII